MNAPSTTKSSKKRMEEFAPVWVRKGTKNRLRAACSRNGLKIYFLADQILSSALDQHGEPEEPTGKSANVGGFEKTEPSQLAT